jgi:hypothetical protein
MHAGGGDPDAEHGAEQDRHLRALEVRIEDGGHQDRPGHGHARHGDLAAVQPALSLEPPGAQGEPPMPAQPQRDPQAEADEPQPGMDVEMRVVRASQ